ncbi:MAG: signal peptide peptidase SppA [Deltaproteobacteria bacterium]|nr:signal peptide peptidase SppA [Deltaproteobacteria bacterium]MBW2068143.1 signal peptide peptidase SppA [Deltaproteobacteria bacterium]
MRNFFKYLFWFLLVVVVILPLLGGIIYFAKSSDLFAEPNRIGVICIRGTISDPLEYLDGIKTFRDDDNVRAIIIRIDSPGGGVSPSQELYREIMRTKVVKPVIASLGSVATSGGYYVASAATKIIASSGTITGSIGVIAFFPNLEELFRKVGYRTVVIKSGRFKDIGNPDRAMTSEEKALVRDTLMRIHKRFVRDVAEARGLDEAKVAEIADGRIITGEDALQLGLVDDLGNFQDAVELAHTLGHIEGKPKLVFFKKKKRSLLDFLVGSEVKSLIVKFFAREELPVRLQYP